MSAECKVCTRPFTVFRWRAGTKGRFKKTEICQTCAKMKNVCQTCLLDLTFNLPVQVRDAALPDGALAKTPQTGINREYFARINEQKVADGLLPYGQAQYNPVLASLARPKPNYERNRAHICSFFVKGTCNRGDFCPYRHELPDPEQPEDLAKQNIKDRYYGVNDPVAKRMLAGVKNAATAPPPDESITTLYIANVDSRITEDDLRDHFYYFGEIKSLKVIPAQHCAFIEFNTRSAAEAAIAKNSKLIVKGVYLRTAWAKPATRKPTDAGGTPPPPGVVPAIGAGHAYYPSMDPERLGAKPSEAASNAPAQPLPKPAWSAPRGTDDEPPAKKQKTQE